jgi:hypothetical protein
MDIFQKRTVTDVCTASYIELPLATLTTALHLTAEVLDTMDAGDARRRYAQHYLSSLIEIVELRRTEAQTLGSAQPTAQLSELSQPVAVEMARVYGHTGPAETVDDIRPGYDPEVAFWATEGANAVEAVLTFMIVGPPDNEG